MAIATFKTRIFESPVQLATFVTTGPVVTIISIVSDSSGRYVLFYTT